MAVSDVVNMQPEFTHGGRTQVVLRSCPGLSEWSAGNPDASEGRDAIEANGELYAVLGHYFYRFNDSGTATRVDRIDGSGKVSMSTDGFDILVTIGDKGYLYNISAGTLSVITDTDFPDADHVTFLSSRFIVDDATDSGKFWYSALLDGSDWGGSDFFTAEQAPDALVRPFAHGGVLILFGSRTVERWRPTSNGFAPMNAAVSVGLGAAWSVAAADEQVFFYANDGSVRVLAGAQARRISTPAVEAALADETVQEATAYVEQGHTVYELSTATNTYCFDMTESQKLGEQVWFRKSTNDSRHKVRKVVRCYGRLLAISHDDGKIYELTRDAYPDVRQFTIPQLVDDERRQRHILDELELIQRSGTGAIPDNDPQIVLRLSRDNGYTWGQEKWAGMGTIGNYDKRTRWRRLGQFRQLTARFRLTDQVEWTVAGVNVSVR